jgi:Holliday junction DNA helicase RuvA
MIGYLSGTVIAVQEKFLILDVGGVGYKVFVTPDILSRASMGTPYSLWIHTVVREDALELFGFDSPAIQELFELLITISGIGPKSALGILSIADMASLVHAIKTENVSYLTQVSGIGKKTAEKIVLELREKVEKLALATDVSIDDTTRDVVDALIAMGYHERAIREALRTIDTSHDNSSIMIREALLVLSQ